VRNQREEMASWFLVSRLLATSWFLARGFFYPEDGGDTFLRSIGSHKMYTAPHPEDGILHGHRCENFKSYTFYASFGKYGR
jgi:hypothetical protein